MTKNNKRILVFSLAYHPYIGGAEIALKEISSRLPQFQFDIITALFDSKNPKEEAISNVKIHRVGIGSSLDKYLFFIFSYFKALKLYQKHHHQLVWGMMANYAGLAALLFKWSHEVKYLLTLQSGDSDEFIYKRTWFWYPLYKKIYKRANKIQVISKWLEKRARSYGYTGEVEVIPNGVDSEKFSQEINQEEREKILSQLNVKSEDKIIITISRLVEKNGIGDLIESLNYLDNHYKLLIIGEGKLEEYLKYKTEDLKLTDRVKFLDKKEHDELYKYLRISDIFIRPSITEGFGTVFLEAMATGVPVIATNVGGIKDFLVDGETGLVCQVNSPQSIAEQVKKIEDNQDLRSKIVSQSQNMLNQYNWDEIAMKMGNIINELCA